MGLKELNVTWEMGPFTITFYMGPDRLLYKSCRDLFIYQRKDCCTESMLSSSSIRELTLAREGVLGHMLRVFCLLLAGLVASYT